MPGFPDSPLVFCPLASGSKGNAIYVSDGRTSLLIDAGLSVVETKRRMAERGLSPDGLSAILVSHEHSDHIAGVGPLSRRYDLTVHLSSATYKASAPRLGRLAAIRHFQCGKPFEVGTFQVHPFSTSHDAADPAGFTLRAGDLKLGVVTDLGVVTHVVREHLRDCWLLLLEANHDPEMLMAGPYPWHLKQRVKGRTGHLSNFDSRDLLGDLLHDGLRHVVLGHLSEQNNTPDKALAAVAPALNGHRVRLSLARQQGGDVITL